MQGLIAQATVLIKNVNSRLDDAWAAKLDSLEARLTDAWAAKLDTLESRISQSIVERIDADISSRAAASLFNAARASNIDEAKDNTATLVGRLTSARASALDTTLRIKSIQRGVIDLGGTSATATLSPVVNPDKTLLFHLGSSTFGVNLDEVATYIELTGNGASVTARRVVDTLSCDVSWQLVEFE